jgi:predicted metal-dependent hydrolase
VEVRRSARRRRTVSAYRDGGRTVVLIPARMSREEERQWVTRMLERLGAQEQRRRPSDEALLARASELSRRHLEGSAVPLSVRWVDNQATRWGSCTPADGSIRISTRLRGLPSWVLDYVLMHELAHLLVPGHGPQFWALVEDFPRTERARGFLEGWSTARGDSPARDGDDDDVDGDDVSDHPSGVSADLPDDITAEVAGAARSGRARAKPGGSGR